MMTTNVQKALDTLTKPAAQNIIKPPEFKRPEAEMELIFEDFKRLHGGWQGPERARELFAQVQEWLKILPPTTCTEHGTELSINITASLVGLSAGRLVTKETGPHGECAYYSECPQCKERRIEALRAEAAIKNGIPVRLQTAKLSDLQYETETGKQNLELCKAYEKSPQGVLLLLGCPGNGKTHAAAAILRTYRKGFFITQSNLLAAHRKTYGDDRATDIREKCLKAELLVLDEVGVSVGGKDEMPLLYDIISGRYDNFRPTILTSNLADSELRQGLGERLLDRVEEAAFAILRFNEPSRRAACNGKYLERVAPANYQMRIQENEDLLKQALL